MATRKKKKKTARKPARRTRAKKRVAKKKKIVKRSKARTKGSAQARRIIRTAVHAKTTKVNSQKAFSAEQLIEKELILLQYSSNELEVKLYRGKSTTKANTILPIDPKSNNQVPIFASFINWYF